MKLTFNTTIAKDDGELAVICEVNVSTLSEACGVYMGHELECEINSVVAAEGPDEGKQVKTSWDDDDGIRNEAARLYARR